MASEQQQVQYIEEDEITLKELILKVQEFAREVWRNWLLVGIIALLFALALFVQEKYFTTTIYSAERTFMINESDSGGGGGAIAGLLGGFGLGGGGGEFNMDKIVGLSQTARIVTSALFERTELGGEEDYIANHIIKVYGYHEVWGETSNTDLHSFLFTQDSIPNFNRTENLALKYVYRQVIGKSRNFPALMSTSYDKDTGFINLTTKSLNSDLALVLNEQLYEHLSDFHVMQQTEPQQRTFTMIKSKADSLQNLLSGKEQRLALLQDTRRNLAFQTSLLEQTRLGYEIKVLYQAYGKALENQEQADFLLKNATPFFQVLDPPMLPLSDVGGNWIIGLIKGGILGVFLAIAFLIGRKIIRDAMQEEDAIVQ